MNSFINRTVALPLVVTLALVACLLPLALLLHGTMGLNIVLLAGGITAAIALLTATAQSFLPEFSKHPLKQLALVGGLRMGLSLAAVLVVCIVARQFVSPAVLLYAVPFYLGLLAAETAVMVGQVRMTFRG